MYYVILKNVWEDLIRCVEADGCGNSVDAGKLIGASVLTYLPCGSCRAVQQFAPPFASRA
jgi:hypothetical protein